MDPGVERLFLDYSVKKLEQLAGRIDDCLGRLSDEQIWRRGSENENAVGNLVLHLCGNLGQWIGYGVAGRPDTRKRSEEFAERGPLPAGELQRRMRDAVEAAARIIAELPPERLAERTVVQGYDVSILEAIYHAVEHFAQHTGQIIYATKQMTGEDLGYYAHLDRTSGAGGSIP